MAASRQDIEEALRGSFLFPLLGPTERERFIAAARPGAWRAGASIFVMGDPGTSMLLVRSGRVRIGYPTPEGRSFLLAELGPGSVFGEIALLDADPRSADATAVSDCTLLSFERRDFLELLAQNWALVEAVLKVVCERLRAADAQIADLAFSNLAGRLAKALIARAQRGPGGRSQVSDTQGALADMVGGSREAVNRCLRKWQGEGLVAMSGGRIFLDDPAGLVRAAGL